MLILFSCSPANKASVAEKVEAAKEAEAPAVPVTAKDAFWPMYTSARKNWSTDFVLLRLTSKKIPGFKNEGGKAALWEATFASPGRQEYRTYSYAIAACKPDIYKGVVVGRSMPWGGATRDVMPIQISEFNVDSDAAYKTAAADAAAWRAKHPDKELTTFQLGNAYQFQTPVWHLMWGDKKSGYVAFVDATTGKVLKNGAEAAKANHRAGM